jgi:hypothetical protein
VFGKASSAERVYVLGEVKKLEELNGMLYHPNGQTYQMHWCASRETVCQMWKAYIEPGAKCPFAFIEQCKFIVPTPQY